MRQMARNEPDPPGVGGRVVGCLRSVQFDTIFCEMFSVVSQNWDMSQFIECDLACNRNGIDHAVNIPIQ